MTKNTTQTIDNIIVGLGATGLSVAKYLHGQQQDFAVVDNYGNVEQVEELEAIAKGVDLRIGDFDAEYLSQAKRLIVNPGIAVTTKAIAQAKQSGSQIVGDIELFANAIPKHAKLAAVTGSNGKSTCVTMLYAMAKQAGMNVKLGGNIGTPALDLLEDEKTELYILELSSYQLETTDNLDCDVACVLNLSPDHLDRYENYQGYVAAKKKLTKQAKTVVIYADDPEMESWSLHPIYFSLKAPKSKSDYGLFTREKQQWLVKGDKALMLADDLALDGSHNIANALAALAMGEVLDLPMPAMLEALRTVKGLNHRTQYVARINDVQWINDSKATNVGATVAAIQGLSEDKKNIILLAGGQTKGADLQPLVAAMKYVKHVFLFGEDALKLLEVLQTAVPCTMVEDLEAACVSAENIGVANDIVLLSPAGASFDQFKNFEVRGDAFMNWVHELDKEAA